MLTKYDGNWPGNVSKDAKYSVRQEAGVYVVGMLYKTEEREKWKPTTDKHPRLVEMVNLVKTQSNGSPGGPFYINEWHQVIVPVGKPVTYYYAGDYQPDLEFEFEGKIITGKPQDFDGAPLQPGCKWFGPHAGIPYVLAAGGRDIYYEKTVRPKVTKEDRLSDHVGAEKAAALALKIVAVAGFSGGTFYINEHRQLFKPMTKGSTVEYLYVGALPPDAPWFPRPHSGHS